MLVPAFIDESFPPSHPTNHSFLRIMEESLHTVPGRSLSASMISMIFEPPSSAVAGMMTDMVDEEEVDTSTVVPESYC